MALRPPLPELAQLLLSTPSVDSFLTEFAVVAAESMSTAASCGITLRREQQPLMVASSDALAAAVDETQYDQGEGPCLQALESGDAVMVTDLRTEHRWGAYPARALAQGVLSSLSVPLASQGHVVGAMNLYATIRHGFDDPAQVDRALQLAAQADAVLSVVLNQASHAQLTERLRVALTARSTIDQAIGILMGQQRCTAGDAFAILRSASHNRNLELRDVAVSLVTTTSAYSPWAPPPTEEP